jgi:outer membrane lipoprotein carrier protein
VRTRIGGGRKAIVGLALLFSAAAGVRSATEGEAVVEARRVESRLNGIRGLVGRFTQTLESPALPGPQEERGTLYLLRPGRMRWEYEKPPGKLAIADGDRTHLYIPADRQLVIAPMPQEGNDTGIAFLLRPNIDLLGEFRVAWGERRSPGGRVPLVLTPKNGQKAFDHLILEVADDHLIDAMTIVDPLGSTITYRFSDLRLVPDLDASLFRFDPPPGTDVQEVVP